jgi:hypothetical protein
MGGQGQIKEMEKTAEIAHYGWVHFEVPHS